MQNLRRVAKNAVPVLRRLWTKVHEILGQCRLEDPLQALTPSPVIYIMFRSEDIHR